MTTLPGQLGRQCPTGLGYDVAHGPELVPHERPDRRGVLLEGRLRHALARLSPEASAQALDEAVRQLGRVESPSLAVRSRRFHDLLVSGVEVEVPRAGGGVRVLDFGDPDANDRLAVTGSPFARGARADAQTSSSASIALVELRSPADEDADVWSAFKQLQTHGHERSTLVSSKELRVVSDGVDARLGSERFLP